jgi:hypothetical protein
MRGGKASSLAGLIPAPVFKPKLKTANRSEPKL